MLDNAALLIVRLALRLFDFLQQCAKFFILIGILINNILSSQYISLQVAFLQECNYCFAQQSTVNFTDLDESNLFKLGFVV
jgi:hypothetical protein